MTPHTHTDPARHATDHGRHARRKRRHAGARPSPFWTRWFTANALISGALALVWLVLRSGAKPSRFAYPCQQAALSAATLAFGAPLVSAVIAGRRRIVHGLRQPRGIAAAAVGLLLTAGAWGYLARATAVPVVRLGPPAGYRAQLYHVTECPEDPVGDRFPGVDNLLALMGREGLKFHRSATQGLTSGPDGIIAADDVVVVKINYQWPERGGTNVDVLRGLILRIFDHPDTFTGEVVVCENAQFNSISNFDRASNNAQDHGLSPHDVVVGFQAQGYNISHYDWTVRRNTLVHEYADGDMTDGYIRYDYDPTLQGRVSYPKFRSAAGTYISLRFGIWDTVTSTYDRERLKFINMPVLKSHHATYGATSCVKHYMGVVSGNLGTNSHTAIRWGILGALLGDIQLADLNLLDAIWINANPYDGPWTTYSGATRRDELVASVDPIAADIWAVKNILIPAFLENGYAPPWPNPSADPDDPNSDFREYLDNSMSRIIAAGYEVTNVLDRIDATTWNGGGDIDGDADVDLDDFAAFRECLVGPGVLPPQGCRDLDLHVDGDIDLEDFARLQCVFTGAGDF
ncbi:MAG: DUF362 domain-containing protein [Phycisphaerae bacterium]